MNRWPVGAMLAPLMMLPCSIAFAQDFTAFELSESFDPPDPLYTLNSSATENATAAIEIGPVGGSDGLIFDGSWNVAPQTQESAAGGFVPQGFQLDPLTVEAIGAVAFQADVEVISDNMDPKIQGIFIELIIFQERPDGNSDAFRYFELVLAGESKRLDVVLGEDDFVPFSEGQLDLGPYAPNLAFGLQVGAAYPRELSDDQVFVSGRMTIDNWDLQLIGMPLFEDNFELPPPQEPAASERSVPPPTGPRPPF